MRPTASERTDDVKGVSSGVPTLVLSPRYSSDSIALWQAALASRWSTTRVRQLGDAAELVGAVDPSEVLIYGETILADAVAAALDLALLEPTYAWLPELPAALRLREIELSALGAARRLRLGAKGRRRVPELRRRVLPGVVPGKQPGVRRGGAVIAS